jgi:hypothetical protein
MSYVENTIVDTKINSLWQLTYIKLEKKFSLPKLIKCKFYCLIIKSTSIKYKSVKTLFYRP